MAVASGHADASSRRLHLGSYNVAPQLGLMKIDVDVMRGSGIADIGNAGVYQGPQVLDAPDRGGCVTDLLSPSVSGVGAHMYVAVEDAGKHGLSAQIDDLRAFGNGNVGAHFFDRSIFHQDAAVFNGGLADDVENVGIGKYSNHVRFPPFLRTIAPLFLLYQFPSG